VPERPSHRDSTEPEAAEICAAGPSVPPEPPEPIVIADATSFTTVTIPGMSRGWWWMASIAASVPWPSASFASQRTRTLATSAPEATTSGSSHQWWRRWPRSGRATPSAAIVAGRYPAILPSSSAVVSLREPYRAIEPIPATAPMSTPSRIHLGREGQSRSGGMPRTARVEAAAPSPDDLMAGVKRSVP
jgi:hypothetical protein